MVRRARDERGPHPRNPNLLIWHGRPFLIDHGASFFRQHGDRPLAETARDVPMLGEHVLLPVAGSLEEADERLAGRALEAIDHAVALVPDAWLDPEPAARRRTSRRSCASGSRRRGPS